MILVLKKVIEHLLDLKMIYINIINTHTNINQIQIDHILQIVDLLDKECIKIIQIFNGV